MAPPPAPRPRPPGAAAGRAPMSPEARQQQLLQAWADGKATLKDVRGYSDAELHAVAQAAHTYFYQGRLDEARTLFHGLFAVDPTNAYFARGLGVVEMAAENPEGALAAFDVAAKLDGRDPGIYVARAEVKLSPNHRRSTLEDLHRAVQVGAPDDPAVKKAHAMIALLSRRCPRAMLHAPVSPGGGGPVARVPTSFLRAFPANR